MEDLKSKLTNMLCNLSPSLIASKISDEETDKVIKTIRAIADESSFDIQHKGLELVARLYQKTENQAALTFVKKYTMNPDQELRWFAIRLLADIGNHNEINILVDRLKNDSCAANRLLAAFALGKIGNKRVLVHLREALSDDGADYEGRTVSSVAKSSIKKIEERKK